LQANLNIKLVVFDGYINKYYPVNTAVWKVLDNIIFPSLLPYTLLITTLVYNDTI